MFHVITLLAFACFVKVYRVSVSRPCKYTRVS